MWIKICANTSAQDANLAGENGADAVGFVFACSPRRVTAGQIATFMPEMAPDLTKIGIFNTQDFNEIASSLATAGLDGVQLHGELDFSLAEDLRRQFGDAFFLIQTLHWQVDRDPGRAEQRLREQLRAMARHTTIDAVLLDSRTSAASGGTGKCLDWPRAKDVLGAEAGDLRVILAGGLTPANVREAIHTLRPWGVDVASGVEQYPGKKDPARLRDFITAARTAFAEVDKLTRRTPAVYPL